MSDGSSSSSVKATIWSYEDLADGTDSFSKIKVSDGGRRLAEGRYGHVYRWQSRDSLRCFAVKRLENIPKKGRPHVDCAATLFSTEILMHFGNGLNHENIVRLEGHCDPRCGKLLLVYELMENGSLADRLWRKGGSDPLSWTIRLDVTTDVCRGLAFIHGLGVGHFNLKARNVLLGRGFNAKLSGFRFSALVDGETGKANYKYRPRPSGPYAPPEAKDGNLTLKYDVYSLGMILYEMATGLAVQSQKLKDPNRQRRLSLKTYVDNCHDEGKDLLQLLEETVRCSHTSTFVGPSGIDVLVLARSCTADLKERLNIQEVSSRLQLPQKVR